ncbi:E3 ubiquitin ligase BIG BROTHER-related, partial [Mucuna pruriens]
MEREEGKQPPQKTPLHSQLEQVNSDNNFVLENEQSGTFTTFASFESESESDSSFSSNYDDEDAEFFLSQEFEADLQFIESQGSNNDDEDNDDEVDEGMEEDDEIDVDELTYEELIELGDFIGQEKRGLSANEICSCLHSHTYHCAENKNGTDRCVICQIEYEEGETLVAIQCEHPYHTDCISKWLQIKKVCPICNTEISVPKMEIRRSKRQLLSSSPKPKTSLIYFRGDSGLHVLFLERILDSKPLSFVHLSWLWLQQILI